MRVRWCGIASPPRWWRLNQRVLVVGSADALIFLIPAGTVLWELGIARTACTSVGVKLLG
ncbi:hypothetical protein [Allokutzneria oryzae]|uniref:Uncharacterized protein n=1 Tax=Allokutzneria oryzae TaxID=1378989 RepID=A0ABV5ZUV4_9PSEU